MNSSCTYNILQRCVLVITMMGSIVCGWALEPGATPNPDTTPDPTYEARIGDTQYPTLKAAIDVVDAEETIVLLTNNITVGEGAYTINKHVTIDLGGCQITVSHPSYMDNLFVIGTSGNLTIIDNGSSGSITDKNVKCMFYNEGILKICSGEVSASKTVVDNIGSSAKCEIAGGTLTANDAILVKKGAKLDVTGGTVTGVNSAISGSAETRDGGTIINITGGTINCPDGVAIYHPQSGTLHIGDVGTSATPLQINGLTAALDVRAGEVSVIDGTFSGSVTSTVKHFISGGTFSPKPDDNLCVEGFAFVKNSEDKYIVLQGLNITDETSVSSLSELNGKSVTATYTRNTGMVGTGTTTGTKYGTICLPFSITGPVTGMTLYKATSIDASTLTIMAVTDFSSPIQAGTPLIFELSTAAETMTVTSTNATVNTAESVPTDGNLLVGTYSDSEKKITEGLGDIYYLNGDKFYKAYVSLKVPRYRAYLKARTAGGARPSVMSIVQGSGNVTSIVETDAFDSVSEVYDISGNKRTGLQQGVNIMRRADGTSFRVIVK